MHPRTRPRSPWPARRRATAVPSGPGQASALPPFRGRRLRPRSRRGRPSGQRNVRVLPRPVRPGPPPRRRGARRDGPDRGPDLWRRLAPGGPPAVPPLEPSGKRPSGPGDAGTEPGRGTRSSPPPRRWSRRRHRCPVAARRATAAGTSPTGSAAATSKNCRDGGGRDLSWVMKLRSRRLARGAVLRAPGAVPKASSVVSALEATPVGRAGCPGTRPGCGHGPGNRGCRAPPTPAARPHRR